MIIYPACYYCLFTSYKQVRLRKTSNKEYYSKRYILYLLVVSAKDYKVNVLHHYDKKIASFQVNGFWFAPLYINHWPNWQYICKLIIAPCSDITYFWALANSCFNQSKKYIETNTKQHGCGHVQVLYRERMPIIFPSNSIQTLWELLHTYAWIQPIAKRWYSFTPYDIDLYFSFMQTSKFWVFLFLIDFEFLEKKRFLGLEQVVVSK